MALVLNDRVKETTAVTGTGPATLTGAPVGFEDPVMPRTMNQLEVLRTDGYAPFEYIAPMPGKLLLFPSWLYHWTKPHIDNFERWNISFNVLPTGKINYNVGTDSTANIELKN